MGEYKVPFQNRNRDLDDEDLIDLEFMKDWEKKNPNGGIQPARQHKKTRPDETAGQSVLKMIEEHQDRILLDKISGRNKGVN